MTHINDSIEKVLPADKLLADILRETITTNEKLFILRKNHLVPSATQSEPIPLDNCRSVVRKLLKPQQQDGTSKPTLTNTENVIKRLDEAIQSLENNKKKSNELLKKVPMRSNSLSSFDKKQPCKLVIYSTEM
jgi:hypothetical protein